MDIKVITEKDYQFLTKKLDLLQDTIMNKIEPQKLIYSETEFCKLMTVSKRTAINWRNNKAIKYSKLHGKIFYTWENILAFLKKYQVAEDVDNYIPNAQT